MSRALGCESPLPFVRLRSNLFVAALAALLLPAAAHASCTTSGNVTTCTSSGGITVSGTAGVSEGSSNVVSSLPGTVTAISVTLTDIDISGSGGLNNVAMVLVAPNGTALDILSGVCDSGEATITLEDSGATGTDNIDGLIPYLGGTCPSTLSGTYNATDWYPGDDVFDPPGPSTYNSAGLDNNGSSDDGSGTSDFHLAFGLPAGVTNMDGTWTLYIATQVAGYTTTGTLGSWSIAFTTEEAASTTTSISANPNGQTSNVYTSANGAATSVALTATVTSGGSPVTAGTVNFYDSTGSSAGDGTIIASGIALNGSGQAVANVDFTSSQEGLRDISAVYSGESGTYAGSISNEATVLTVNHPSNPSSGTYCNGPITIKSNSSAAQDGTAGYPYPSQIILSGISGTIENLTVELNGLQAEDPNYMGFMLQAPSGNALELMSWTDGNGPGGDPPALTSSSTDVYLDDTGSGLLQGSQDTDNTEVCSSGSPCRPADDYSEIGPLFTDTFPSAGSPFSSPSNLGKAYPTGTATLTSQFAGGTANGTWLLLLNNWLSENTSNNSSLPYGQLNQWCLSFTMQEGADATATTVSGTPNPASITSGTTASVTFTANVKDVSNSGTVVNAGSVTFVDGSTTLGTSPVNSSGQATLTASLNEGTHQIVASYSGTDSGSPEFGVSTGKTDVRVNKATTNPTTGSGAGPYSYCNAGSITAPGLSLDYGAAYPYPSNISVTNLPGTVEATTLTLNGFQTKDQGDLMSLLAGPGGSTLEFFSLTGSNVSEAPSPFNLTFSDTAESTIPSGSGGNLSSSGSYKPTSYNTSIAYPQCGQNAADCGTEDVGPPLGSASTFTPPFKATTAGSSILGNSNDAGEFGGTSSSTYNGNGTWSLYVDDGGPTGDGETTTIGNGWCVSLTVNPVSVTSEAGHSGTGANGNFEEGETNAQITATVNVGSDTGPTGDPTGTNPLTLTDALNSNFTYQSFSGAGWSCTSSGQTVTCTNDSAIAEGGSYPDLAINVNVASSPTAGSVTNQISVSGAGVTPTNSGIDTIAIDIPPAITSGSSATFAVGSANSFTVTTTGTPTPAIQETGSLPSGLTFTDNGNGTATLAGTPGAGTGAQYSLSISADNGTSPNATQTFTLTVDQAPAITSASGATFEAGSAGSFTVTAGGYPTPLITETGNLPAGVTLNTSGVLSGTPAAGTGGSYPIVINASNGVGSNATQNFTLLVEESPAIT
ncbi:MAG TPA: Ig-like domain-containing protein, partial [Terracidiphilus sp.]|nr:Ig-like domain-containing protein [Terracidiphilus sp.]